jgi:hypothetical protein
MTSSRQQGNRTENLVAKYLEDEYGYYCYPSRGSRGIDLVCLANPFGIARPHLMIEVGTESKSVKAAFAKISETTLFPGSIPLVVRKIVKNRRISLRWHSQAGVRGHENFWDALVEARTL